MSVARESWAQRWRPRVQLSWDFLNNSVFNLRPKVKNVSADRVLMSSEFRIRTAGAAAENAREDKNNVNMWSLQKSS